MADDKTGPWDFTCADCETPVTWFVRPPSQRCAMCHWLVVTAFTAPEDRARMREVMLARGMIGGE